MRISATERGESRGLEVKRLLSKNKPSSQWLFISRQSLLSPVPGRSQHLLQKLLDFDEVCFEGAVVEEERRVGARGKVFELRRLPADGGEGRKCVIGYI